MKNLDFGDNPVEAYEPGGGTSKLDFGDNPVLSYEESKAARPIEAAEQFDANLEKEPNVIEQTGEAEISEETQTDHLFSNIINATLYSQARKQSVSDVIQGEEIAGTEPGEPEPEFDDEPAQQYDPMPLPNSENAKAVRAMNKSDFDKGISDVFGGRVPDGDEMERVVAAGIGLGEGSLSVLTSAAGFLPALGISTIAGTADLLGTFVKQGKISADEALQSGAIIKSVTDGMMEALTYAPRRQEGQSVAQFVGHIPNEMDKLVVEAGEAMGMSENAIATTQVAMMYGGVFAPGILKAGRAQITKAAQKMKRGETLSEADKIALENMPKDWEDLRVLDEAAEIKFEVESAVSKDVVEAVRATEPKQPSVKTKQIKARANQKKQKAQQASERRKEKNHLGQMVDSEEVNVVKLSDMYTEWEIKKGKNHADVSDELGKGVDIDTAPLGATEAEKIAGKKFDEEHKTATDKIYPKQDAKDIVSDPVVTTGKQVRANGLYMAKAKTAKAKKVLENRALKKKSGIDPEFTVQQQVNNINSFLHGDKNINIETVKGVLSIVQDQLPEFRQYFPGDAKFQNFEALVVKATRYALDAESNKKVLKPNKSVKLGAGFDPTEFYSVIKDSVAGIKGFTGKMKAQAAMNKIKDRVGQAELDRSGVGEFLDTAIKDGRAVTATEITGSIEPHRLVRTDLDEYSMLGRSFRKVSDNYADHVYEWKNRDFKTANKHFDQGAPQAVFNTRISDLSDGKTRMIEEIQSDYFQAPEVARIDSVNKRKLEVQEFLETDRKSTGIFLKNEGLEGGMKNKRVGEVTKIINDDNRASLEAGDISQRTFDARRMVADLTAADELLGKSGFSAELSKDVRFKAAYSSLAKQVDAPFEKTWLKTGLEMEVKNAIADGKTEIGINTARNVINAELGVDISNKPKDMSIEAYAKDLYKNASVVENHANTVVAIYNRYEKSIPKTLKQILQGTDGKIVTKQIDGIEYRAIELTDKMVGKYSKKTAISLRSGIDPFEIAAQLGGAAKKGINVLKERFEANHPVGAQEMRTAKGKARTSWVDVSGNSKAILSAMETGESYTATKQLTLRQGAMSASGMHSEQMRKAVFGGQGRKTKARIEDVMFLKRVIDIDKSRAQQAIDSGKPVRAVTHPAIPKKVSDKYGGEGLSYDATTARDILVSMRKEMGAKRFDVVSARAEMGFTIMGDMLKKGFDEGIITKKTYESLKGVRYLKRQSLLDTIDPLTKYRIGSKKVQVRESGVEVLQKGRVDEMLEMDSQMLMTDVIQATYGRIANNKANMALRDIAKKNSDNGIVVIPKRKKNGKLEKAKPGWQEVKYYEKGEGKSLYLHPEFADGWITGNREISVELARLISMSTGTSALKFTATGMNPDFALKSLIRDPLQIFMASEINVNGKWQSTYSDKLPVFAAQYGSDLIGVAKDAANRSGRYMDAELDGMLMGFLGSKGKSEASSKYKAARSVGDATRGMRQILTYVNETSEIVSRLSVRERAIKTLAKEQGITLKEFNRLNSLARPTVKDGITVTNPGLSQLTKEQIKMVGDIRTTASATARDYMDFGNAGSAGKAVDTVIPYFNAAIQATRGMARAGMRRPAEFGSKAVQLAGVAGLVHMANEFKYKDDMDKVPSWVKENNFIFMTDITSTDNDGVESRFYFKLPKDPGQAGLMTAVEAGIDKFVFGKEVDGVAVAAKVATSFSPTGDRVPIPPMVNGLIGVLTNVDLKNSLLKGRSQQVWNKPGSDYPTEEYDNSTPQWAVSGGEFFGMSPSTMQHVVNSMFARNTFGDMAAAGLNRALGDDGKRLNNQVALEEISKSPFAKTFMGLTYDESEKVREEDYKDINNAKMEQHIVDRKAEKLVDEFLEGEGSYEEVSDYAWSLSKGDRKRVEGQLAYAEKLKEFGGEYKAFWNRMRTGAKTEVKAGMYVRRWKAEDSEGRDRLEAHRQEFGFDSNDFNQAVWELMDEAEE